MNNTELYIIQLERFKEELLNRLPRSAPRAFASRIILSDRMFSTAGKATRSYEIKLNRRLLNENKHHIETTLAHELAHLVDLELNNSWSHKDSWKHIMRTFGYEPDRCHNLDTSKLKRKHKTHKAKCLCREYDLKQGRVTKMIRGVNYICRRCKNKLELC